MDLKVANQQDCILQAQPPGCTFVLPRSLLFICFAPSRASGKGGSGRTLTRIGGIDSPSSYTCGGRSPPHPGSHLPWEHFSNVSRENAGDRIQSVWICVSSVPTPRLGVSSVFSQLAQPNGGDIPKHPQATSFQNTQPGTGDRVYCPDPSRRNVDKEMSGRQT